MYFYAINEIDRGRSADPRIIPPGHVIELPGDKVTKQLVDMIAIREATDDEVKIAKALGKFLTVGEDKSDAGETTTAKTQELVKQEASKGSDPVTQEPAKEKTERELLEERATAAGVEFRSNIGDEKLLERVLEAEKAVASTDNGSDEASTTLV